MSEEDSEPEAQTMEEDQAVRDALMQVWFTLQGEEIGQFTGTSIPIPREGDSVRLSNIEVPPYEEEENEPNGESSTENQPTDEDGRPLEAQTNEGKEYLVGDVSYNYYKAMLEDGSRIDAPVVAVGVDVKETEEEDNQ